MKRRANARRVKNPAQFDKPFRIDRGHDYIGGDKVYCREFHDGAEHGYDSQGNVLCRQCGAVLPVKHVRANALRANPVPSFALRAAVYARRGLSTAKALHQAGRDLKEHAAKVRRALTGKSNPPNHWPHWTTANTRLSTWFERDRASVMLEDLQGNSIVEWWDEAVAEAVEDGFLTPKNWHESALEYANAMRLAPQTPAAAKRRTNARRTNPPGRAARSAGKSPVKIYGRTEKIFMQKTEGPYKGQHFVHHFKGGVQQTGLPAGSIVKTPDGKAWRATTRTVLLHGSKNLWRNFAS